MMSTSEIKELHTPSFGTISITSSPNTTALPSALTIIPTTKVPTDIWRKPGPPLINTFNAPALVQKVELKRFQSLRAKVSASWKTLYDQGGLVFILPASEDGEGKEEELKRRWVKTGIEFYEGNAFVSTVACDNYADWSLADVAIRPSSSSSGAKEVELLIERKEGDDTFWVYAVDGGKKFPLREVTWVLSGEEKFVWVGVYAATPIGGDWKAREELVVKFEGIEVGLRD